MHGGWPRRPTLAQPVEIARLSVAHWRVPLLVLGRSVTNFIEDNGNQHLMRILSDLKRLLLRYEYAFMRDDTLVVESVAEHNAIAKCMERGDRREAVRLLGDHWDRCTKVTLADFLANGGGS